MTVDLASWLLQFARILLNFRFHFKIVLKANYLPYTVLTTFTYTFIFKGLIFSSLALTHKTFLLAIQTLIINAIAAST